MNSYHEKSSSAKKEVKNLKFSAKKLEKSNI